MLDYSIRKATHTDASTLTDISYAAKRFWKYPDEYFDVWVDELTITNEYISNNIVYLVEVEDKAVGYFSIVSVELSSELVEDYLSFFDNTAFTDNPHWAGCYCYYYHYSSPDWEERTGKQNRQAVKDLICLGKMHGFLAYSEGKPVGWCHVGFKKQFIKIV